MGFAYSPLSLIVLREAPPESQGAATPALQLSDVLGTALGTGVGRGARSRSADREGAEAWVGLAWAFGVGVVVAARRRRARGRRLGATGRRRR